MLTEIQRKSEPLLVAGDSDADRHRSGALGGDSVRTARQIGLVALKFGLSLGLMAVLLLSADWAMITERLRGALLVPFALALIVLSAAIPAVAWRWGLVSRRLGTPLSFPLALRLTYIGLFFGQILPGTVGGDAARGWLAYRAGLPLGAVASSIFLDRVMGLIGLSVLVVGAMAWFVGVASAGMAWLPAAVIVALVAGLALLLALDRLPLPAALRRGRALAALGLIPRIRHILWSRAAAAALAVSVAVHLATVLAVSLLAYGLNLPVGLFNCLLVVPIAVLMSTLPISLGGWGVRDGAMVAGFGLLGVGASEALLLSVLFGVILMLAAMPGGALAGGATIRSLRREARP